MSAELRTSLAFALPALLVLLTTPLAGVLARRTDFLDHPVGYKGHDTPTPYLGGLAVIAAFVPAALAFGGGAGSLWPIVVGALALWALGTVDDRVTVRPRYRLVAEGLLAWLLWESDLGWATGAGAGVDLMLTIVWVVAIVMRATCWTTSTAPAPLYWAPRRSASRAWRCSATASRLPGSPWRWPARASGSCA